MYTDFFKLKTLPFSLTPNLNFFCELSGHQAALKTLLFSIHSGEGFIKIVGEVGTGKTLLCRKLLESLDSSYMTAYIPNPELSPLEIRKAVAFEFGLDASHLNDHHQLITATYKHLIATHANGKKAVLIIDEAQALSDESLETIRLLTNLETEESKLIQVVLFGQPELDKRLNQAHLRQLKQRISFSYSLPLLTPTDLDVYLQHRLTVAGCTNGQLFTKKARKLLHKASGGIPRIVNILSHKALLVAYGEGTSLIDHKAMRVAMDDTEVALSLPKINWIIKASVAVLISIVFLSLIGYLSGSILA